MHTIHYPPPMETAADGQLQILIILNSTQTVKPNYDRNLEMADGPLSRLLKGSDSNIIKAGQGPKLVCVEVERSCSTDGSLTN
jgi:hypothetical protein